MASRTAIIGLVCLGLLIVLAGVRAAICDESRVDLLLKFVVACGMAMACVADSRRIRRPMAEATPIAIVVTWPIAVPIYLVWSRGWRRGLLAAAAFLGSVVVLAMVPFFAAGYIVWGAAFFRSG